MKQVIMVGLLLTDGWIWKAVRFLWMVIITAGACKMEGTFQEGTFMGTFSPIMGMIFANSWQVMRSVLHRAFRLKKTVIRHTQIFGQRFHRHSTENGSWQACRYRSRWQLLCQDTGVEESIKAIQLQISRVSACWPGMLPEVRQENRQEPIWILKKWQGIWQSTKRIRRHREL